MKIYTKTGDDGETGLFAGPRVAKDHPRIEACGTVDELNAALGHAVALDPPQEVAQLLVRVQHELFALGAELSSPQPQACGLVLIEDEHVVYLERTIDRFEAELPPLDQFILPGGSLASAALHLARSVCRRAERRVVSLRRAEPEGTADRLVRYLNRLGDLLFVLARSANAACGCGDVKWIKPPARYNR